MSQDNVRAARGLYDMFNRSDIAGFEKGCARELVWNEAENSLNSGGNPYRGFDAVLEGVFQPTLRDFDRFECNLELLIDGGDTIVGTGRYRGTYKETGKRLSAQFCHVLHFDSQARLDRVRGIYRHPRGGRGCRPVAAHRGNQDCAPRDVIESARVSDSRDAGAPPQASFHGLDIAGPEAQDRAWRPPCAFLLSCTPPPQHTFATC